MADHWCKNVGDVASLCDLFVGNCACFSGSSYVTVENYEDEKAREQDDIHFEFKSSKPFGTIMFVKGTYDDQIHVEYNHNDELTYLVDLGKGKEIL